MYKSRARHGINRSRPSSAPRYLLTVVDRDDSALYSAFADGNSLVIEKTDRSDVKTEVSRIPKNGTRPEQQVAILEEISRITDRKVVSGRLVSAVHPKED